MVGLPAAPFLNVLLRLWMEPKTDYRLWPNTRATAFFSYYDISVGHAACLTTKRARRESSLGALIVLRKGIRLNRTLWRSLRSLCSSIGAPRGTRVALAASTKLESGVKPMGYGSPWRFPPGCPPLRENPDTADSEESRLRCAAAANCGGTLGEQRDFRNRGERQLGIH